MPPQHSLMRAIRLEALWKPKLRRVIVRILPLSPLLRPLVRTRAVQRRSPRCAFYARDFPEGRESGACRPRDPVTQLVARDVDLGAIEDPRERPLSR